MKRIVFTLLFISIISPALAEQKRTKSVEQIKRNVILEVAPVPVLPNFSNENWDRVLGKAKDQNSGG